MSLSELGAYLQRQREEQGLSYADIEAQTRIRATYLRAIEFGEWDGLPPGVYTRGLIKMYARALGLSPSTVLRMYTKERPTEARLPEPQLMSRPLVRQPRLSFETVLSGLVLLVAGGLLLWMVATQLWPAVQDKVASGAATPTVEAAQAAGETPVAAATDAETATPTGPAAPTSTLSADAATALAAGGETPVAQVSPTAATPGGTGTAEASGAPTSGLVVQIEAVEDSWLSVQLDDATPFAYYKVLHKGDTPLRFVAKARVVVRTGNAVGTRVTVNGRDAGLLGDGHDVKDIQWELAADGNIVQQEL